MIGSLTLLLFREGIAKVVELGKGGSDVPLEVGLGGIDRWSAVLPRRLLLLLKSLKFPTSATRAPALPLRGLLVSVGDCDMEVIWLPREEDSEGGGTEGYESCKGAGAGKGGGGAEWREAEDGVVRFVALEIYEAGLIWVMGEKGKGEGEDAGEVVRGVLVEELSLDDWTIFVRCRFVLFRGMGTADKADRVE